MAVAVWAMKAIFYGLDPNNTGFARLGDVLGALAQVVWPRDVSAPAVPLVSENMATSGLATAATADEETREKFPRILRHVFAGLGVGMASLPGAVNGNTGGCKVNSNDNDIRGDARAHAMDYVLCLLDPRVSLDLISSSRVAVFRRTSIPRAARSNDPASLWLRRTIFGSRDQV